MLVGSDGQTFNNDFELEYAHKVYRSQETGVTRITVTPTSPSRMPLEGSEKVTGEFKSQEGTTLPPQENTSPEPSKEVQGPVDKLLGINGPRYQTWPERVLRSLYAAMKAPGEVFSGELPVWAQNEDGSFMTSPQVIEKMSDLADLAVLGPMPIAAKLADGTLGSFAGIKAQTADRNKLKEAYDVYKNTGSVDEMFNKTGWFLGVDNKVRFEIPDTNAKLNLDFFRKIEDPNKDIYFGDVPEYGLRKVGFLRDVYDHPELFAAYPHLGDIYVTRVPDTVSYRGVYKEGAPGKNSFIELSTGPLNTIQSVLAHEIQHAIQSYEGFAKGGAPVKNPSLRWDEEIQKLREEQSDLLKYLSKNMLARDSGDKFKRLDYIRSVLSLDAKRREAAVEQARYNYKVLSGEVEARNVQTRLELTKEGNDLSNIHPDYTMDVPRNEQVSFDKSQWATPYGYGNPKDIPPYSVVSDLKLSKEYYDKIPQDRRLSNKGISHPGIRWEIYDPSTGKVMATDLQTKSGANRSKDRLDNKYGSYKYRIRPVKAKELTEEEIKFLKDNDITLD